MKEYELTVLIHPDLEADLDAPLAKVRDIITNAGGTIVREDNWGKKKTCVPDPARRIWHLRLHGRRTASGSAA